MANISDIIEDFILQQLSDDLTINLSRNELADFFGCAPSQINYVLATRFTPLKGFDVESRRGGGGYIKVVKLDESKDELLKHLVYDVLKDSISYNESVQILDNLMDRLIIDEKEYNLIKSAISPKALSMPIVMEDTIRAKILKNIFLGIIRR